MAINKKFIHFKRKSTFQRELDAGNILNTSMVFISDSKLFYVNGQFFSENTLFDLNLLLENVSGELSETDTTNEAVIKLYKLILQVNEDTNNIIKLLVSEIDNLRETTNEHMDKTDKIVASGLSLHNNDIDKLKTTTEELKSLSVKVKDHLDNKDLQHIPEGGHDRQILAWKEDGTAEWKDLATMFTGLEDILAYGVEWDITVADPHITRIGNMALHKSLPILSLLKGCIALGNLIMYWLNKDDWNFKGDTTNLFDMNISPTIETNKAELDLKISSGEILLEDLVPSDLIVTITLGSQKDFSKVIKVGDLFKIIRTPNSYPTNPKVIGYAKVTSIVDNVITLVPVDSLHDNFNHALAAFDPSTYDSFEKHEFIVGEPSRLDGYDGTVRVYCPDFYIKSLEDGNKRRVWISTVKIDDTWEHLHEILVDAYKSLVLKAVPDNMGYLSTLLVGTAISVTNTSPYCRGGSGVDDTNSWSDYDQYLKTDRFKTLLGKHAINANHINIRVKLKEINLEIMSYFDYKNIFYWLYVIEYANFNSQEEFNDSLTEDGYRLGGMNTGLVTGIRGEYNSWLPIQPNGYLNEFGNNSAVKELIVPSYLLSDGTTWESKTFNVTKWRGFENLFGDSFTYIDGVLADLPANPTNGTIINIIGTRDPSKYIVENTTDAWNEYVEKCDIIGLCMVSTSNAYIKEFNLGSLANIFPINYGASGTTYKCDIGAFLKRAYSVYGNIMMGANLGWYSTPNYCGLGSFISHNFKLDMSNSLAGFRTVSTYVSFPK